MSEPARFEPAKVEPVRDAMPNAGNRAGASPWARDVVRVHGPDAQRYLQGQLSQDLTKIEPGASAWTLVLQPQGKLDVFARITRLGDDEFVLDTDAGMGEALASRLQRFLLRTKATIQLMAGWSCLAIRCLGVQYRDAGRPSFPGDHVVARFDWNGWSGYDLLGPAGELPGAVDLGGTAEPMPPADLELQRILAGFPVHGAELDNSTIPAEAHLVSASVSFTKGCYTGQELVARVDSRGNNVPRRLYGLVFEASEAPLAGSPLAHLAPADGDGVVSGEPPKPVGRVTSVARRPNGQWLGLGYANRSVAAGDIVVVVQDGTGLRAQLHSLPMSSG